jgi:hypothetical protein
MLSIRKRGTSPGSPRDTHANSRGYYDNGKSDGHRPARYLACAVLSALLLIFCLSGRVDEFSGSFAALAAGAAGPCRDRVAALLKQDSLAAIDLSGCELGAESRLATVRAVFAALPELRRLSIHTLDLSSNGLTSVPFDFFFASGDTNPIYPALSTLFLSDNALTLVPPVLRRLHLTRLSLKANRLTGVDANGLPPGLVHLILTENRIHIARSFNQLVKLRKLMLSGNQLTSACAFVLPNPDDMSRLQHPLGPSMPTLELLRLARNNISSLTAAEADCFAPARGAFPQLRWLSLAGNPVVARSAHIDAAKSTLPELTSQLHCADAPVLGQGASGEVKRCRLVSKGAALPVAVKFFKRVSSDGSAADELDAVRLLPKHPAVLRPLGWIAPGPLAANGAAVYAVMTTPKPLGRPPTIETVTADRFDGMTPKYGLTTTISILQTAVSGLQAMHTAGVAHGDFYAHNLFLSAMVLDAQCSEAGCRPEDAAEMSAWARNATASTGDGSMAALRISDFGASYEYTTALVDSPNTADAWRKNVEAMEVRSFAVFVQDVVDHMLDTSDATAAGVSLLQELAAACGGGILGAHIAPVQPIGLRSEAQRFTTFDGVAAFISKMR